MIGDLFLDCQITGAGAGNVKNESGMHSPEAQAQPECFKEAMTSHKVVRKDGRAVGGMRVGKIIRRDRELGVE